MVNESSTREGLRQALSLTLETALLAYATGMGLPPERIVDQLSSLQGSDHSKQQKSPVDSSYWRTNASRYSRIPSTFSRYTKLFA